MKDLCTNHNKAQKKYNTEVADRLFRIINLLECSPNLEDVNKMRIYHLHKLIGDRKGTYALDIGRKLGYRLIVIPLDENGKCFINKDSNEVYKLVKIVGVEEVSNHYDHN